MKKIPIDDSLLTIIRLAQAELPVLTEQDVFSIFELLKSDDDEIKITGIYLLNTFNYFQTPETIMWLFQTSHIDLTIDKEDAFANIVRLLYLDSDRFQKESSDDIKKYDLKLKEYAGTIDK